MICLMLRQPVRPTRIPYTTHFQSVENRSEGVAAAREVVLKRRGRIRSAVMRAPGARLSELDLADIDGLVDRLEQAIAQRRDAQ